MSTVMTSHEEQFRAIVGHNHTPSRELDGDQARAISALIFSMPETQFTRDGSFIEYEGWDFEQNVYMTIIVSDDHDHGSQAFCEPLDRFDENLAAGGS
jgi:hypothetical protein